MKCAALKRQRKIGSKVNEMKKFMTKYLSTSRGAETSLQVIQNSIKITTSLQDQPSRKAVNTLY